MITLRTYWAQMTLPQLEQTQRVGKGKKGREEGKVVGNKRPKG